MKGVVGDNASMDLMSMDLRMIFPVRTHPFFIRGRVNVIFTTDPRPGFPLIGSIYWSGFPALPKIKQRARTTIDKPFFFFNKIANRTVVC